MDSIIGIIAMTIKCAVNFCMLLLLYQIVDEIAGWSFMEMLFLYGMSTVSFALWHCFFIDVITIPLYIQTGEFDRFLLKPVDPLFQIMMETFDEDGWGELFFGIILLVISIVKLKLYSAYLLLIPVFCISGCLIAAAISIFCSSVAFLTVGNIDLTDNVMDFKEFAKYPITIFNKGIMLLFTAIIPIGFTAYYPSLIFLRNSAGWTKYLSFATLPVAVLFFGAAWLWWHHSLKYYGSSGN